MRYLSFTTYLSRYLSELTKNKSLNLHKLLTIHSVNHRIKEVVILYAVFSNKKDILLKYLEDLNEKKLISKLTKKNYLDDTFVEYNFKKIWNSYNKVNQLRHVRFFHDLNGIKEHMKKHADILRPKFEKVEQILDKNFLNSDLITFTRPRGGYFISLDCNYGVAKEVVEMCNSLGVYFTPAGSSFPYHKDPHNTNIRLAPSYPSIEELEIAINVLSDVIKYQSVKKVLE